MGTKKITDLELISAVSDALSVPSDDSIQSYRFTALQFFNYMAAKLRAIRTFTSNTAIVDTDFVIFVDPTSSSFTQDLPALAGVNDGFKVEIKNIATNGNTVTLDGNSTETIDGALTLILNSLDAVRLVKTSSGWFII